VGERNSREFRAFRCAGPGFLLIPSVSVKTMLAIFMTLGALPCLTGAQTMTGVFSSPRCAREIEEILIWRGDLYRSLADRRGYPRWAADEYAKRRARARFLESQSEQAVSEFTIAMQGVGQDIDEYFALMDMPTRESAAKSVPFTFSLLSQVPPRTAAKIDEYDSLMLSKTSLYLYRHYLSQKFLGLPLVSDLTHASPPLLNSANEEAIAIILEALQESFFGNDETELDRELKPVRKSKRTDSEWLTLSQKLIENTTLPFPVREEIYKERDFERKYGYSPTVFFKWFLHSVNRYFKPKEAK
jgi:hypothetical protein